VSTFARDRGRCSAELPDHGQSPTRAPRAHQAATPSRGSASLPSQGTCVSHRHSLLDPAPSTALARLDRSRLLSACWTSSESVLSTYCSYARYPIEPSPSSASSDVTCTSSLEGKTAHQDPALGVPETELVCAGRCSASHPVRTPLQATVAPLALRAVSVRNPALSETAPASTRATHPNWSYAHLFCIRKRQGLATHQCIKHLAAPGLQEPLDYLEIHPRLWLPPLVVDRHSHKAAWPTAHRAQGRSSPIGTGSADGLYRLYPSTPPQWRIFFLRGILSTAWEH